MNLKKCFIPFLFLIIAIALFQKNSNESFMAANKTVTKLYSSIKVTTNNELLSINIESLKGDNLNSNIIYSVDIYPKENPNHPDRHFGFWNYLATYNGGGRKNIEFNINLLTKISNTFENGAEVAPSPWIGDFAANGQYIVNLVIWDEANPDNRTIFKICDFSLDNNNILFSDIKTYAKRIVL